MRPLSPPDAVRPERVLTLDGRTPITIAVGMAPALIGCTIRVGISSDPSRLTPVHASLARWCVVQPDGELRVEFEPVSLAIWLTPKIGDLVWVVPEPSPYESRRGPHTLQAVAVRVVAAPSVISV
jgi:hypothetical protein